MGTTAEWSEVLRLFRAARRRPGIASQVSICKVSIGRSLDGENITASGFLPSHVTESRHGNNFLGPAASRGVLTCRTLDDMTVFTDSAIALGNTTGIVFSFCRH